MADPTVPAIQDLDEEAYDSAEDEEFELDAVPDDSDLSSDDDETGEPAEPAKKKRKTDTKRQIPGEELDSGDEVTIRKAKEKKANTSKGTTSKGKRARDSDEDDGDIDMDDDEGGTGGFVRTRAMRKNIQEEERKPLAKIDGATVDVDALWEQMNAPESQTSLTPSTKGTSESAVDHQQTDKSAAQDQGTKDTEQKPRHDAHAEQMTKIKRTYKFAGEWITEEKVVPKHSAEAKAFLSSGENVELTEEEAAAAKAALDRRRPLRKISRFDPNPTGAIKKSWEKQVVADDKDARGPKINTVEKSRLDWASYVDKAGIEDELRSHSKAKEGYIGRMDFLGRMEDKREQERRAARLKGI
ncbi:hypothetical protein N7535_000164 [Penicillium sp. DV-2018c]|nr:hypothetical protein N7535_000164 [Penicillium sp. DV-2018c]